MATVDPSAGINVRTAQGPGLSTQAPDSTLQPPRSRVPANPARDLEQTPSTKAVKTEPSSPTGPSKPSSAEIREIAESLGQVVSIVNQGISIRIDESTDTLVTEIVNRETNEVVKQIPPQELVQLAGRLREFLGILLDIEV